MAMHDCTCTHAHTHARMYKPKEADGTHVCMCAGVIHARVRACTHTHKHALASAIKHMRAHACIYPKPKIF